MARYYKIKVNVNIEECSTPTTDASEKGVFERVIPAEQACSIDAFEQVLVQLAFDAQRDAFARHLSRVSSEYALEAAGSPDQCRMKFYRVDSEIGRIVFPSWWPKQTVPETEGSACLPPFPPLHARQWYRTEGFNEIAMVYGTTQLSYRKTEELLARVRHQKDDPTPSRTLQDNTECEGQDIMAQMDRQAAETFHGHGFTPEGEPTDAAEELSGQSLTTLPQQKVEQAIRAKAPDAEWITEMTENPVAYEDPKQSTEVSLDDVCVKRQKSSRKESDEPSGQRKSAYNTIAHIRHTGKVYILNGHGIVHVLRLILAFLLHNSLLQSNLIFFVDGHRILYAAILKAFAWFSPLQIILDWYHLKKKCQQLLSMALKGREIRNGLLEDLLPCLWNGCVDKAIAMLQSVNPENVKKQEYLDQLIDYLERNRPYIPCYSVRKHLGLRNSSNQGEKANDLVVSNRQKDNGMSWSKPGSNALAAVTALVRNNEYKRWFQSGTLTFGFCSAA